MTTDGAAPKLIRSFVAVPLPPELQTRVFETAKELAILLPQREVRWSRKVENLHVTIKFLGPTPEERLTGTTEILRQLAHLARVRPRLRRCLGKRN